MPHDPDYWMYRQVKPRQYPPRPERELWRLTKTGRTAACAVAAHPLGRELIVYVNDDLLWSEVYKPERDAELEPRAEHERQRFAERGWQ